MGESRKRMVNLVNQARLEKEEKARLEKEEKDRLENIPKEEASKANLEGDKPLTKEEQEVLFKSERSLRIQSGSKDASTELKFVKRTWDEATIRSIAFCDRSQYSIVPYKNKYDEPINFHDDQIDMPFIPKLLTLRVFDVVKNVTMSDKKYDDLMIKAYATDSQRQENIWSTKRIKKIVHINSADPAQNVFQNVQFVVVREKTYEERFTLVDLPLLNPADLFIMLRLLVEGDGKKGNVYTSLITHFRKLLKSYYEVIGIHDGAIAKLINVEPRQAITHKTGIQKLQDGHIIREKNDVGIVLTPSSSNPKKIPVKLFLRLFDANLFPSYQLQIATERVDTCTSNSAADKKEVMDTLKWAMKLRSFMELHHGFIYTKKK